MDDSYSDISRLFGIELNTVSTAEFLDVLFQWVEKNHQRNRFITYLNAHCANVYFKDKQYADIVDKADLVYADGQAVVWAARFLGQPLPERVNAGDFFLKFLKRCAREKKSVYFLGSYPRVVDKLQKKLLQIIPDLKIAGFHHGFFKNEESQEIIENIKKSGASFVLTGMGVPLQEKFAWNHLMKSRCPVIWCVGALFEYYAGETPRAPVWMRKAGLEWLFRLLVEPKRMWKRYIIGNIIFIFRTLHFKYFRK